MRFHFCTNDKWYSKAASFIGQEPHTHIGVEFFHGSLDLVIDCTKPHSKLYHMKHWVTKYDISNTLELFLPQSRESSLYNRTLEFCLNEPYDWNSYYYLWFLGLRRFIFGTPFPDFNKFNGNGLLCMEIMEPLTLGLFDEGIDLFKYDFSIVTPTQIYKILKEQPKISEVPINANKKSDSMG